MAEATAQHACEGCPHWFGERCIASDPRTYCEEFRRKAASAEPTLPHPAADLAAQLQEAREIIRVLLRDGLIMASRSWIDDVPDLQECFYCKGIGKNGEDFHAPWCAVGRAVRLYELEEPSPDMGPVLGHYERAQKAEERVAELEERLQDG